MRVYTGDLPHVRYLKISEGCDHGCAFCAIPLMRGKHRSFALDDVVREAQLLELQGAREVNLVAQDLAHYGRDRRDGVRLPELLEALLRRDRHSLVSPAVPVFRGTHAEAARGGRARAAHPPYLDMPIQHASDAVLERMRRPERQRTIRERVRRVRERFPISRFARRASSAFRARPTKNSSELLEFLEEMQFDRVGAFTYSPQEGTRAHQMPDDVPEDVKRERLERLPSSSARSPPSGTRDSWAGERAALVDRRW